MKTLHLPKTVRFAFVASGICALAGAAAFASDEQTELALNQALQQQQQEEELELEEEETHKWLSLHAYADIESAYVCRGFVWDSRPCAAQFIDGELNLGDYGRFDGYVWTISALSSKGHSTSMRNAFNEVDYGIKYSYDIHIADEWTLVSGVGKLWVTNPGVRHNAHSLIDWQVFQSLRNPYITPYWKLRYIRRPYHAAYWCVGALHEFGITDNLSFTVDFFGDFGDARHYRHLYGPKPNHPESNYHGGLHALNLVLRLDWKVTENFGLYAFVAQLCTVSQDAREALHESTADESKRDITYGGVGLKLDF